MPANEKAPKIIGQAETVSFPEIDLESIAARIDTGARTSTIWASHTEIIADKLHTILLDDVKGYKGIPVVFDEFERIAVASSNGHIQHRFMVRILVSIKGKRIRARFTLADRSTQVYPVLIGRNILRGKFLVDVKKGRSMHDEDKKRWTELQATLGEEA